MWRGIVVISQSIASVEPGRILIGAKKRFLRARVDRHTRLAQLYRVQRVARCLPHIHVAGNHCDRAHANVGCAESHDERDSVIRSGIRVDQKSASHARKNSRPPEAFDLDLVGCGEQE